MKCCCNPFTAGVTIGSLYIVGSVIAFIFEMISYIEYDERVQDPGRREYLKSEAIENITVCSITILISSLYIMGILKRCHELILPWLLLAVYVFYVTVRTMYWWFIGAAMGGASGLIFLVLLLIAVTAVAIQFAIFYFSCSLFRKIRLENIETSERVDHHVYNKNLI